MIAIAKATLGVLGLLVLLLGCVLIAVAVAPFALVWIACTQEPSAGPVPAPGEYWR